MLKNFKNKLNSATKNSNMILWIIASAIFLIAIIYFAIGIIGFLK